MHIFIAAILSAVCLLTVTPSQAEDFVKLLRKVESHPNVVAARQAYLKRSSTVQAMSSLKDPSLKVSALNLPTSDLSFDKTPMSSKQVALMQRLPLTTRLSHLEDSAEFLGQAGKSQAKFQVATNKAQLWIVAAKLKSLNEQLQIVDASLNWIKQVDKSTQRLYSTGKTNQINLLEIKVRKSELESQEQELKYKVAQAESMVGYLAGTGAPSSVENVPWKVLENRNSDNQIDHREKSLQKEAQAAKSNLRANQLAYVPDLTVGAAYSFREDIDGQGDFVSGFVQFSIPLWGETKNKKDAARAEASEKAAHLQSYKLRKKKQVHALGNKVAALEKEMELTSKSIEFAETEQKLATKRYSLGKMSIFELLEIELKLRKKKSRKEMLLENLRSSLIELLLLKGDRLHV